MRDLDILISGAGVAGPVVAYWLLKGNANHKITIVERSDGLRTTGQSIDIRQSAVDVIRRMGVEDAIRAKTTTEDGIRFVDDEGKAFATFPATGDSGNQSFTSEYEIFRGDLVRIFFDLVKDRVETVLGEYVQGYRKEGDKLHVSFVHGRPETAYDLVVACDGQSSRLRELALSPSDRPREHWRPFYNYCAYFSMRTDSLPPDVLGKGSTASWYNTTKGRVLFIRPDPRPGVCRANIVRQLLDTDDEGNARYRAALAEGMSAFTRIVKEDFAGAGWITSGVVEGMQLADDLYASETAQIQCPTLIGDRLALVGDAGYCPTPLTGMGTSLAIIGAYILAGEVTRLLADTSETSTDVDINSALQKYNEVMLPYSRQVQNIPARMPQIANPQSAWGITIARGLTRAVYATGIVPLLSKLAGVTALGKQAFQLPEYEAFGTGQ